MKRITFEKLKRNFKYKKILSVFFTFSLLSIYTFPPIVNGNGIVDDMSNDNSSMASIFKALIGNPKISDNVSYSYTAPSDIENVIVQCSAEGDNSKEPIINTKATYKCFVQAGNAIISLPIQRRSITPTSSGEQTLDFNFPALVETKTVNKQKKINNVSENILVTITLDVEDNSTTSIETGSDAVDATIITNTDSSGNTNNSGSTNNNTNGDSSTTTCSDGTYWCPEDSNSTNGTNGLNGADGTNGLNGADGTDGANGSSGANGTSGSTGTNGTSGSGSSYKDLLDDLLDDRNGSYNSGDNDWSKSNNGDGSGDLDNYFMGSDNGDDSIVPNGTTSDLLGIDNSLQNPADENNEQNNVNGENTGDEYDGNTNGDNGDYDGNADGSDNSSSDENNDSSLPLQDLSGKYQDGLAGLDGLTGDNNSLLGAITGDNSNSSLSQKMKDLVGDNSLTNNAKGTASNQELFDTAKKILLAAGFSMNDIQKGKNYDANSAYTEPGTSWDMNRITTLLSGKKIKLTSPTDIKTNSNNKKTSNNSK